MPVRLRHVLPNRLAVLLAGLLLTLVLPGLAAAQPLAGAAGLAPIDRNKPVTFIADQVEYDREAGIVTASGHVEAWQGDHVLRADKIVYDRNTDVAAAFGNVVLFEPNETLFSDYAELTEGMRDGVLRGMRSRLAENGRLVANGVRRTEGKINELSRVVYTTCNLCAQDPTKPPLWQIRALSAVQDTEHKKIEYYDAVMEMYGVPIAYFPYFWHPDPSVKRASGLLLPSFGSSHYLGAFYAQPYYAVIDDQSDLTVTPMVTTKSGLQLSGEYRYRFNEGTLSVFGSGADVNGQAQGSIYAKGRFNYDDTWRYGFDLNRASSSDYVRNFSLSRYLSGDANILTSQAFVEGFGEGAYTRLDARAYQGLSNTIVDSQLPVVMPRYVYNYVGQLDQLGGRFSATAGAFNVVRTVGTNTQRANLTLDWERPATGPLGDLWKLTLHGDAATYNATRLNQQPNFSTADANSTTRALPQFAVDARWPFVRDSGSWGSQVIEPRVQLVVAPRAGDSQLTQIPNEDSLDLEFTDQNLFGFNRFPGIDRLEGGQRINAAMQGTWYLGGTTFDAFIGQSYQSQADLMMPVSSGLRDTVSDIVGRISFAPTTWLNLTYRTRLDKNSGQTRFGDALATVGGSLLQVSAGYIYTTYNPYNFYNQAPPPPASSGYTTPRNEITLGADSRFSSYHLGAYVRRDLTLGQFVNVGANVAYEDECYILQGLLYKRYTSINGDNGSTTVLLQMTFKTIGQFGYRAL
jgi:LPS-assembly protein